MKTWSKEQLRAFLEAVADERLGALWHVIAMTGMRRGEAIGLRWSDVDLENARLSVRRALIPTNREVVVERAEDGQGAARHRPRSRAPSRCSRPRRHVRPTNSRSGTRPGSRPDSSSRAENGEALDPESVSRYWRQAVKKAMLPTIRLHDLRHTHATLALQAGIHPKVVSERLGHATVSITLDTYSHAIPAMQEEAAALIAGLVFAGSDSADR